MSAADAKADLIAQWRSRLTDARRRSPHTVRAYVSAAQHLIQTHDVSEWSEIAALEANDLRAHLATRRAEGLGNSSAARELSALKALITYARAQSGDPEPAAPRLRGPRLKKGLPASRDP